MKGLFAKLFDLKLQIKIPLLILFIIGVGAGCFFALIDPKLTEKTELKNEVEKLNSELLQKKALIENLPRYEEELKSLEIELRRVIEELPDDKSLDTILDSISEKARNSGLDIKLFRPQPEMKRDFYAEIPLDLELSGTFHQIATFFDEVGKLSRIININQFAFTDPEEVEDKVYLKGVVSASAFRFLDEKERIQQTDTATTKKGKKRSSPSDQGSDLMKSE